MHLSLGDIEHHKTQKKADSTKEPKKCHGPAVNYLAYASVELLVQQLAAKHEMGQPHWIV